MPTFDFAGYCSLAPPVVAICDFGSLAGTARSRCTVPISETPYRTTRPAYTSSNQAEFAYRSLVHLTAQSYFQPGQYWTQVGVYSTAQSGF